MHTILTYGYEVQSLQWSHAVSGDLGDCRTTGDSNDVILPTTPDSWRLHVHGSTTADSKCGDIHSTDYKSHWTIGTTGDSELPECNSRD